MHANKLVAQNRDTLHCCAAHVNSALESTFQTAQPLGERLSSLYDTAEWGGLSFLWSPEGQSSDISYKNVSKKKHNFAQKLHVTLAWLNLLTL